MSRGIMFAKTDQEIQSCYAVMAELRPHVQPDEFLQRINRPGIRVQPE